MNNVNVQKAISESEGLSQITLLFYSIEPEPLIDAVQEAIKSTVNEHAKDESFSNKIRLVIALTPEIKLNLGIFEEQFGGMIPFFNEQFVQVDAGPRDGEPFELTFEFQEDEPVAIHDNYSNNQESSSSTSKPWWKVW